MRVSSTLISHWQFCAMFRNTEAKKKKNLLNYEAVHISFPPQITIKRTRITAFSAF